MLSRSGRGGASVAGVAGKHLADVPEMRGALGGVAAGIAGGVADIGGMRAAVETRDVERPVVFLLQRGGAAADGAFLQFDLLVKLHRSSCAALYKRDKGGTAKPVRRARSARKGRRRMEMLLSFYYSGSAPKLE